MKIIPFHNFSIDSFECPFFVEDKCPKCGTTISLSLTEFPIQNPSLTDPSIITFVCEEPDCIKEDVEWEVSVQLGVTLKEVKDNS